MADVKLCIDLLRSKYYVCRIDATRKVLLLVPHQFDNASEARLFMIESRRGYHVVKQAYSSFVVRRGSQILDGPPLPIDFYIPNVSPTGAPNMERN